MLKKISIYLICISIFAGCSNSSKDIVAQYVSPQQYSNYDCVQLNAELMRVAGKVRTLTGKLDKNNENDKTATGVALILFWPAVFFSGRNKRRGSSIRKIKRRV